MTLTALALLGAMLVQVAPTPNPPTPPKPVVVATVGTEPPVPTLTATEQIAINTVSQQQQENRRQAAQLQQEATAIIADIAHAHPGYHLGADGKLTPDPKPEPPPPPTPVAKTPGTPPAQ